jgi:hypothetical protein
MQTEENKLDRFSEAFSSGGAGCRRQCECGRVFYDTDNGWDWGEGELEALQANKEATPLSYAVSTMILEGREYARDCNCWHTRASKVIEWLDSHNREIARYLNGEQAYALAHAKEMPTVKAT